MSRNERRIQKAIDEILKIIESGKQESELFEILERLRTLETIYETN